MKKYKGCAVNLLCKEDVEPCLATIRERLGSCGQLVAEESTDEELDTQRLYIFKVKVRNETIKVSGAWSEQLGGMLFSIWWDAAFPSAMFDRKTPAVMVLAKHLLAGDWTLLGSALMDEVFGENARILRQ